jgi:hypothetical protein
MNFYAYCMDSWKETLHKQVTHSVFKGLRCRCFCLSSILFISLVHPPTLLLGVQGMSVRAMNNIYLNV